MLKLTEKAVQLINLLEQLSKNDASISNLDKDVLMQLCRDLYIEIMALPLGESQIQPSETIDNEQIAEEKKIEEVGISKNIDTLRDEIIQERLRFEESFLKVRQNEELVKEELEEKVLEESEEKFSFEKVLEEEKIEPKKHEITFSNKLFFEPVVEEEVEAQIVSAEEIIPELVETPDIIIEQPKPEPIIEKTPEPVAIEKAATTSTFSINKVIHNPGLSHSLLDTLNLKPIPNLKAAVGLNEKFLYIRELFNNDHLIYADIIAQLNEFNSLAEAENFLQKEFIANKKWDLENDFVISFLQLVYRRFV
jgi:hypothetical protein